MSELVKSHDFVGLVGTQSMVEAISMLPNVFPRSHLYFCIHISRRNGGVMFAVSKVHIDKCVGFGWYSLMNGRLLHFWSDSAFGSLDFFVANLDL